MRYKVNSNNFNFSFAGYGHYKVTYTTGRGDYWIKLITDMQLIDATKNADEPKTIAWHRLRRAVQQGTHYSKIGKVLD